MRRVYPQNRIGFFHRLDVDVDSHRLPVAATQHAFQQLGGAGIDFLVRHIRRHVDEIARPRLGDKFKPVAPPHAGTTLDDINYALQMPVVVRARTRVGVNSDRASP